MSEEETDSTTMDLAKVLYETAMLRSGYTLQDSGDFAGRIERMLRLSLGVDVEAPVRLVYRSALLCVSVCTCVLLSQSGRRHRGTGEIGV